MANRLNRLRLLGSSQVVVMVLVYRGCAKMARAAVAMDYPKLYDFTLRFVGQIHGNQQLTSTGGRRGTAGGFVGESHRSLVVGDFYRRERHIDGLSGLGRINQICSRLSLFITFIAAAEFAFELDYLKVHAGDAGTRTPKVKAVQLRFKRVYAGLGSAGQDAVLAGAGGGAGLQIAKVKDVQACQRFLG